MSAAARPVRGVLDTSTVILLPRFDDATTLPQELAITAVTLAELSVGPLVTQDERQRAARQAHLQQAEADFDPLPFDAAAARAFGGVAASLRRAGRKTAARTYDAMIAATAIANQLPLYTCNPHDFAGIDGLDVVAIPVHLQSASADPSPVPRQAGRCAAVLVRLHRRSGISVEQHSLQRSD